ncbi:MAG: sigma-70 family RNA polymerase sigma factor [Chloroflexi bacterium]|nr:sigma-70 family RNA polymerase sigma factor [Chloroflexota bacterium]
MDADQERLWVLRARSGDPEAFTKLVEAYQNPVYNLAYRMLGSPTEAQDAAQETFLRVYTRLDTYDPQRKFSSWILSVASHHCIDRLRRQRGNTVSMEEIMSWRWIPDEKPKPEERTLAAEQNAAIRRLLMELPEQYRLAIVLRYWHDQSYEEIAEMTGSSVSAVKSRLHRARQQMAVMLAEMQKATVAEHESQRRVPDNALSRGI